MGKRPPRVLTFVDVDVDVYVDVHDNDHVHDDGPRNHPLTLGG